MQQNRVLPWVHTTNIYEVNVRQYTPEGTFKAFSKHLPRLKEMGVEVIWLMPVTPISLLNRKGSLGSYYACSSYVAINPEYGNLQDFRELVGEIHRLDMKIIIDWVANHTGWDHEWTKTHPDFYHRNHDGSFRPPVADWEDVIHLNFDNENMRETMIRSMQFWVDEFGIDGFRCDMAMMVPLYFWQEARTRLDKIKSLFWLGEFDQWGEEQYGQVFDVSYTWHWMHVAQEYFHKYQKMHSLDAALSGYNRKRPYAHLKSFFTSNHDENSWNGTEHEKYGPMAIPLAVFSCLWNGIPLIYSGQELPNHKRLHFFDKDLIEWNEKPALHLFYSKLLHFRKEHPALANGQHHSITWRISTTDLSHLFSFVRRTGNGKEVIVVLNLSSQPHKFSFNDGRVAGIYTNLFTGKEADLSKKFSIDPWGYLVLYK
ncbi:MAG: alpha-amylase family glycosyl hydrolase [Bacteroidota bacterium]